MALPQLPLYFTKSGHFTSALNHSLMVFGSICDTKCSVHFHKCTVTIYDPQGLPLLQGWRDNIGANIWPFSLRTKISTPSYAEEVGQVFTVVPNSGVKYSDLQAFSAYDLPIVESLVQYFHADSGFPVNSMWLDAIKAGNFAYWPALTYQNSSKYCPSSDETIKFHMAQTRQNIRLTKPNPAPETQPSTNPNSLWPVFNNPPAKLQARPVSPPALPTEVTNEVHRWETPISKLYSDDTGRFPVRACSENQYVMIFLLLLQPHDPADSVQNQGPKASPRAAYNSIWGHLKSLGHKMDLQILYN